MSIIDLSPHRIVSFISRNPYAEIKYSRGKYNIYRNRNLKMALQIPYKSN